MVVIRSSAANALKAEILFQPRALTILPVMEEMLHGMANFVNFMRNRMGDHVGLVTDSVANRLRCMINSMVDSMLSG